MLLEKFFQFGVLARNLVRNHPDQLNDLLRKKFIQKVFKKGCVYYELTEKALPLAESYRLVLFHQAKLKLQLTPHSQFHRSLLEGLRFLDDKHPLAEDYQLLGDWQLTRPVVSGQLKLAKLRYYEREGLS